MLTTCTCKRSSDTLTARLCCVVVQLCDVRCVGVRCVVVLCHINYVTCVAVRLCVVWVCVVWVCVVWVCYVTCVTVRLHCDFRMALLWELCGCVVSVV